mgnify:CR=1 FL=1
MKITKSQLKQIIKEEFKSGQRGGALERLIRDAAEDALKQGKGAEEIGLMVVDMLTKAGVNLDPRRNLLDPKTTDPDARNMQKVVNKYDLSKMAKPKALDEVKITKSQLKRIIKEELEGVLSEQEEQKYALRITDMNLMGSYVVNLILYTGGLDGKGAGGVLVAAGKNSTTKGITKEQAYQEALAALVKNIKKKGVNVDLKKVAVDDRRKK